MTPSPPETPELRPSNNQIDIRVAGNLRQLRVDALLTQEQLGKRIGVSGAQIQKLEAGVNWIGAAQLWLLSEALNVPLRTFFCALHTEKAGRSDRSRAQLEEELEHVKAQYARIIDPNLRKSIRDILERMARSSET